ncbi:OLC1v1008991C1 [Oldenlandia corymbosa var. corymbosa]|uniref:OLC1v1008991C1 n=1 Tax=Oldenlandia corymbosa var. corymbosa TaxID=529605 RepID=A0AAV1DMX3_OLDCO|nr:OLC1v1008991C1 [Oldenlandia corymbosa var. corymbosa]
MGFQTPGIQSPLFQVPVFQNQGQTDQVPLVTPEMVHQRFASVEHTMAAQVEQFENAFQRLIDHSANTGGAGSSGSAVRRSNTTTGTARVELPPVDMVNNPLYNAIFQPSATEIPVQHTGKESRNNGLQTVSNAARQGTHSWITYGPQGTLEPGLQGSSGAGTNQGYTGAGSNQGHAVESLGEAGQKAQGSNDCRFILYQNRVVLPMSGNNNASANLADSHIRQGSDVVVANPHIAPPHPTVEENRKEQQWMENEGNHILNRNRAQAADQPVGNRHNPHQQRFWG